ncbi:beta-glucosidase family protein [Vallitalea okinawensis]|uniref:beta-glucosidase family protein n=1 Tax=Vallitalea okinawensis TaxID=2078660 RepID=UPI000CFCC20A|nr:glycoside hydrolase family 3 C-terminal domain-containing protein [Vallitalea okinawensis]
MENSHQIIEKYTSSILSRLNIEEKIRILCGKLTPLEFKEEYELGDEMSFYNAVPYCSGEVAGESFIPVKFVDGPRGVVCGSSTCFPVTLARGASFDPDLERRIGVAMAKEAKSYGGNLLAAVCINIIRHLRGGRIQESYSEDMHVLSKMGSSLVKGIQSENVMACVKHFACNNIENTRRDVNVLIDKRTLHEIYLPHFKACVDAGAVSVMAAYNKVNGKYCCESKELLTDILRDQWGFQGFIMSDFIFGIHDAAKAINAGLDLEMPVAMYYKNSLKSDINEGLVLKESIDEAVKRLLVTTLSFYSKEEMDTNCLVSLEHVALAKEAADKGIVLIKNEDEVLPITKRENIAVYGELVDVANLGDRGSSYVRPPYAITLKEGLMNRVVPKGCSITTGERDESLKMMKQRAMKAHKVIIAVGNTYKDEGEFYDVIGGDRESVRLSEKDQSLIKELSEVNDHIILVVYGSGFIFKEIEDRVKSIVMAWYPGMEGGNALADILYGNINPSGKLPITLPENEGQMTIFDNRHLNVAYDYYHGYMLIDKMKTEAAYPFGFGLSYTTFKFDYCQVWHDPIEDDVIVRTRLTNTGGIDGVEVVQVYTGVLGSTVHRAKKTLKAFRRIALGSGHSKEITFKIPIKEILSYYDVDQEGFVVESSVKSIRVYTGNSSSNDDLIMQEVVL